MSEGIVIDEAFERYRVLAKLLELEQQRARSNPLDRRYIDLGIVGFGDTKVEASRKVAESFDKLTRLAEHVAILDMAGSFERFFRAKIGSAIGAARDLIKSRPDKNQQIQYGVKLVKSAEDFEGMKDIVDLIEGALSKSVIDVIRLVRKSRNGFAHGTDLNISPVVEPLQARDNLNEAASHL